MGEEVSLRIIYASTLAGLKLCRIGGVAVYFFRIEGLCSLFELKGALVSRRVLADRD